VNIIEQLRARIAGDAQPTDPMRVSRVRIVPVTAGELRAACQANPTHPLAATFAKAVAGFPDGQKVNVEHADLAAVIDNADVATEESIEENLGVRARVVRKTLVPRSPEPARRAAASAPTPAASPAPAAAKTKD